MSSITKSIIDKHDISKNGMFSPEDVQNIIKDHQEIENSSSTKRKIIISACVLVTIASAIDAAFTGSNNRVTYLPAANVGDSSVRHLQEADGAFADWVECDALATIPISYVNGGDDSSVVYACKPTDSRFGCGNVTASPTTKVESSSPSSSATSTPTISATSTPTISSTSSPSKSPVSSSPTDTCYDELSTDPLDSGCEWLNMDTTGERKEFWCSEDADVRTKCPVTCGTCCGDNPNHRFTLYGADEKSCAWVADGSFALGWCNSPAVASGLKTFCAKTCGTCGDYISMKPSAQVTLSMAPSAQVTLSMAPSDQVSPPPSVSHPPSPPM